MHARAISAETSNSTCDNEPAAKRRWLRFSLRTLVIAVPVLVAAGGEKGVRNRFYTFFGQTWGQLIPMKATVFASDRLAVSRPRLRFIPETVPDTFFTPKTFVFDNGRVTIEYFDKGSVTLKMRLDSSTSPKSFDAWYDGDDPAIRKVWQNLVYHGIYEIDGDKLRRCYTLRGGSRPTEFKQGRKLPTALMELERVKQ